MLFRKTPSMERETYRFHSATGEVFEVTPEEAGAETIRLLHSMDDAEVYNNIKNSRPKIQPWQQAGIEQWKAQHPGEELPKNWNMSLDGLTQTEEADCSAVMKELADKVSEEDQDSQRDLLRDVVAGMPEEQQELYRLYFILELSQAAIAVQLGVSQNAVSKRIRKLKAAITEKCREKM